MLDRIPRTGRRVALSFFGRQLLDEALSLRGMVHEIGWRLPLQSDAEWLVEPAGRRDDSMVADHRLRSGAGAVSAPPVRRRRTPDPANPGPPVGRSHLRYPR